MGKDWVYDFSLSFAYGCFQGVSTSDMQYSFVSLTHFGFLFFSLLRRISYLPSFHLCFFSFLSNGTYLLLRNNTTVCSFNIFLFAMYFSNDKCWGFTFGRQSCYNLIILSSYDLFVTPFHVNFFTFRVKWWNCSFFNLSHSSIFDLLEKLS